MELVCTIRKNGNEQQFGEYIGELKRYDVKKLRFNMGKFHGDTGYNEIKEEIEYVREHIRDVEIMLDIPYPGNKQRLIFLKEKEKVKKGALYKLKTEDALCREEDNIIYLRKEKLELSINDILHYDNGEGAFKVVEIESDLSVKIVALNDFWLFNNKSLSYGRIKKLEYGAFLQRICSLLNPEYLSLSFIEDISDLNEAIYWQEKYKYKVISKIETEVDVALLEQIVKKSDGIMLGRGDYCLTGGIRTLFTRELELSFLCKKYNKEYYIATDFLPTLCFQYIPSRGDIIDFSLALALQPTGLVLNVNIIRFGALSRVVDLCEQLNDSIEGLDILIDRVKDFGSE